MLSTKNLKTKQNKTKQKTHLIPRHINLVFGIGSGRSRREGQKTLKSFGGKRQVTYKGIFIRIVPYFSQLQMLEAMKPCIKNSERKMLFNLKYLAKFSIMRQVENVVRWARTEATYLLCTLT